MDPLLKLLHENAALKPAQLAAMLNLSEAEVAEKIKTYEAGQVILGYRTVLNEEKLGVEMVRGFSIHIQEAVGREQGLAEGCEGLHLRSGGWGFFAFRRSREFERMGLKVFRLLAQKIDGLFHLAGRRFAAESQQPGVPHLGHRPRPARAGVCDDV